MAFFGFYRAKKKRKSDFTLLCFSFHYYFCMSALLLASLTHRVPLARTSSIWSGAWPEHTFSWLTCWSIFMPLSWWWWWWWCPHARACCGIVSVAAVNAIVAAIAAIAKVVDLLLWFNSQKLSSSILYFECVTSSANNTWEFVDIFKHY